MKETELNETKNPINQPIEKASSWFKNSVTVKLITITILMLLLLIPASMIKSIIHEREQLSEQATLEVNKKWANSQELNGPVLTIPVTYEYQDKEETKTYVKNWNILPKNLKIDGKVDPQKLKRGIYEVVVYKSDLSISGDFNLNQKIDLTDLKKIHYDKAFLTIGVSDLRGIKNQIKLKLNKQTLEVEPGSKIPNLIYSGVTINIPNLTDSSAKKLDFDFKLKLQGSKDLTFIPIGSNTEVTMSSTWDSPSFNGNFLPDVREVNQDGFSAKWKVLQLNRNFPTSWFSYPNSDKSSINKELLKNSAFGFSLILPLDDYQKSMRSAKYAVMTIALTFLIFFLVEILNRRKIHPFQYALVGLSLCLFYVLLVSITEHTNFNFAFGISTLGIVSMISLYSLSVFKVKKLTLLLIAVLMGIYGFLFVTLQLADYALLMGSIGLILILAATMYFTRNINWYQLNFENK